MLTSVKGDRVGETILDRRTHACKGPEGGLAQPRGIKKGCVASAQNLRQRKEGGAGGTGWGVGYSLTVWSLPAMVDNTLTTIKA